jgi:2-polyprenyl-3-methyl-5-hydroxy-6-metoxy-1,4-benzoquinol methylase
MQPETDGAVDDVEQGSSFSQLERAAEAACPWCGDHQSKPVWRQTAPPEFSIRRCDECGLAYTVPQLSLESMSQYYPSSYYGSGNLRFNRLFEVLVGWFRRRRAARLHQLRGERTGAVLDIGCGRGHFLNALRQRGWACTGTELSDKAANHARETLALDVRVGPFREGMFPDDTFDVVFLWHVLEHIPDTFDALMQVRRLLRTGGMLVVALPNLASWQARLSRYGWFHLDLPRHYVHCSIEWLLWSLSQLEFEIVEVNHFSMEQNVYGWIQSLLNCMGLKKNLLYDVLKHPSARDVARPFRTYPAQTVVSIVAAGVLLPLAGVAMLAEALFRRGGTIEVYASRKRAAETGILPGATESRLMSPRNRPILYQEPSCGSGDRQERT